MMGSILVVDDEPAICKMLSVALQDAGHIVAVATSGREALKLYREQEPDLAMIDIIMPVQDGIETIGAIRKEFPDARIIAMSGGGRIAADTYLGIASNFGVQQVLAKPFKNQELLDCVDEAMAG